MVESSSQDVALPGRNYPFLVVLNPARNNTSTKPPVPKEFRGLMVALGLELVIVLGALASAPLWMK